MTKKDWDHIARLEKAIKKNMDLKQLSIQKTIGRMKKKKNI